MKRTVTPELLDSDSGSAAEVAASLADLRRINRWFGGASTTADLLQRAIARAGVQQTEFSVLDVGGAGGDVMSSVAQRLKKAGWSLLVTVVDRARSHLNGHSGSVAGDALSLPFASASFDFVCCSLLAHHLEPDELVCFADEALRVSRRAVLINDLIRHPAHLALVYGGSSLFSRLTRHDGPASVRRAYTVAEMENILQRSRAHKIEIRRHYLYRMAATLWKS